MEISSSPSRSYSVCQINEYARGILQNDPILRDVSVRGEVSNLKRHSSGHIYFTLKDSEALLRCSYFRQHNFRNRFPLADGMQIVARGYISIYARDGAYQLVVSSVQPDGVGALYALFEKTKASLAAKGLFDEARKRPMPAFARKIAVVTSSTGAVLRDIARVARRRMPGIEILLLPVNVQGEGSASQIARALDEASELSDVDVVIVARGGGSLEDLWAFNEEEVAYAIARCKKPVVSAVGHETDFTIADFAADLRAATPSQAAELCVADAMAYRQSVSALALRARRGMDLKLDSLIQRLARVSMRPVMERPDAFLQVLRQKKQTCDQSLALAMEKILQRCRADVLLLSQKAKALGPSQVLKRGYAIVRGQEGNVVKSVQSLARQNEITIILADGQGKARVVHEQTEANL